MLLHFIASNAQVASMTSSSIGMGLVSDFFEFDRVFHIKQCPGRTWFRKVACSIIFDNFLIHFKFRDLLLAHERSFLPSLLISFNRQSQDLSNSDWHELLILIAWISTCDDIFERIQYPKEFASMLQACEDNSIYHRRADVRSLLRILYTSTSSRSTCKSR